MSMKGTWDLVVAGAGPAGRDGKERGVESLLVADCSGE